MLPQIFSNTCPLNWAMFYKMIHSYWSTWLVTNIPNLSPTHLVTYIRHRHRCNQFWLLLDCCLLFIVDGIIYSFTVDLELRNSRRGAILNDQYRYKSVWLMFFYQDCIQILATYINKIRTSQKYFEIMNLDGSVPLNPFGVRTSDGVLGKWDIADGLGLMGWKCDWLEIEATDVWHWLINISPF